MIAVFLLLTCGIVLAAVLISETIWAKRFERQQQGHEAEAQAWRTERSRLFQMQAQERVEWRKERDEWRKERSELLTRIQQPQMMVGPDMPTTELPNEAFMTADQDEYAKVGTIDTGSEDGDGG